MSERNFVLERFYFGVFAGDQKPKILARSAELTGDQAAEILQIARVEPPTSIETSAKMPATVGLFRGESARHVLAIARINASGRPQILYLLIDSVPMSWLGGNLQPFKGLMYTEMPTFDKPTGVRPLSLDNPNPPDAEMEYDAVQSLLLGCQDNMKVVEGLLTAFIQDKTIAIVNAPPDLDKRLNFIEGLTSLLPLPARVIATFATSVAKPENSTAQIQFLAAGVAPQSDVVFDWQSATLTPAKYDRHDYARYMVSLLRLDPETALQQTRELSRTTSWRAIRRDNLEMALHWVARRAKVDSAVQAGQAADRSTVSSILREDPTLTQELRIAYVRHLLSITLALEEWSTADLIPEIAAGHEPVAKSVVEHLRETAVDKDAIDVFNLVLHWIKSNDSAKALPWYQLLHIAIMNHLEYLLKERNLQAMVSFIYQLVDAEPELKIEEIAPRIAEFLLPGARQAEPLAQAYLVFAAQFMVAGSFQDVLADEAITGKLSERQQKAIAHLQPEENSVKPLPNILTRAVENVPPAYRMTVLLRLIETGLYMQRFWLIGERDLKVVSDLSKTDMLERYEHIVRHVADEFSKPERIQSMNPAALQLLPQLYFTVGEIDAGVRLLEHLQNQIFTVENLTQLNDLMSTIFLKIEMPPAKMLTVLAGFDGSKLRPEARLRAYFAALINLDWDEELDVVARQVVGMIEPDPRLIHIIGAKNILRLLQFHANRQNRRDTLRLAGALIKYAVQIGEKGPPLIANGWKMLMWNDEVKAQSHELLRQYIRMIDPDRSLNLPIYFAREVSPELEDMLNATRLMRIITGGRNFLQFGEMIRFTRGLLLDMAITYHEGKAHPSINRIRQDLQSMTGNLGEEERQIMSANLLEIARLIVEMGSQESKQKEKERTRTLSFKSVLTEARQQAPTTPTEFLVWFGLNFADTFVTELGLERKEAAHIFGARSLSMLYQETLQIYQLLFRMALAFPEENPPQFKLEALKQEIDSLWDQVPYQHQQRLLPIYAEATQQMGLLLVYVSGNVSAKALSDRGAGRAVEEGKRQPQNEIEALRFVSGYFARKHDR